MARSTNSPASRARRKKLLNRAKGYRQGRSKLYRRAKEFVEKGLTYAFRDRRVRKRQLRSVWIARISAACKANGTSYSVFMSRLKAREIGLNRKMLADLAFNRPEVFARLVERVR